MNTNSYFTVEGKGNGTLYIKIDVSGGEYTPVTVYYWKNVEPNANRDNYTGTLTATSGGATVSYVNGDIIKFYRAETTAWGVSVTSGNFFNSGSNCIIYGNLGSLIGFTETLPQYAFTKLFYFFNFTNCSGLEFPWETVPNYAYQNMFYGCNKFSVIPDINAVTLGNSACFRMFRNCTGLVNADFRKWNKITTVSTATFQQMCINCSGLKSVYLPVLPSATNLWNACFSTCSNLEFCQCLDSSPTTTKYGSLLYNCAASGTFIKHPDATWTGITNAVPTGWTVKNMNQYTQTIDYSKVTAAYVKGNTSLSAIYSRGNVLLWGTPVSPDYEYQYFTIECITSSYIDVINNNAPNITFYYSKNGGEWVEKTTGSQPRITLDAGDKLRFYASPSSAWANDGLSTNSFRITTGEVKVYGNIMSLVNGTSTVNTTQSTTIPYEHEFTGFLSGSTAITDVSNLVLPAVNLTKNCYQYLFQSCDSITTAPVLPATTLVDYCYYGMFRYCSSLNYIKCLANDISATQCTGIWVTNVAASGTFVKAASMSSWSTGTDGIPLNWTVQNA